MEKKVHIDQKAALQKKKKKKKKGKKEDGGGGEGKQYNLDKITALEGDKFTSLSRI